MGDLWVLKGSNQILEGVHTQAQCAGQWCTIHNPLPGPWADWPMKMTLDGMIRICPHGYRHNAVEDILLGITWGIHTCDGCPCIPAEWEVSDGSEP